MNDDTETTDECNIQDSKNTSEGESDYDADSNSIVTSSANEFYNDMIDVNNVINLLQAQADGDHVQYESNTITPTNMASDYSYTTVELQTATYNCGEYDAAAFNNISEDYIQKIRYYCNSFTKNMLGKDPHPSQVRYILLLKCKVTLDAITIDSCSHVYYKL